MLYDSELHRDHAQLYAAADGRRLEPSASRTATGTSAVAREASDAELRDWDALVARFPSTRVVHERCWTDAIAAGTGATAVYLIVEKGGDVVGAFPGLIRRAGPLRLFGSPLVGWQTCSMGPTFDPNRVDTTELMRAAVATLEAKYSVHHIELISGALEHDAMRALGFTPELVDTLRAPLAPKEPERTFKRLSENARRNIRRAERLGLRTQVETDEGFVREAYDQITEVFLRGGNTVPFSERRVLEFFRHMTRASRLVALSVRLPDGDTPIAVGLFTIDGKELFLWQWAHRTSARWYRPTELMTWTAMKLATEAGCTSFDLMGPGEFKEKFGAARDVTQYRWVRSRYKWLAWARHRGERAYRWQQAARGRARRWRNGLGMPPGITNAEALRNGD